MNAPHSSPTATLAPKLGRYTLLHELAHGGMGSVYLAQTRSKRGSLRWVAIKTIHPHMTQREDKVNAFFDEARISSRIAHPNVCAVYDFGEDQGAYFLVMEYLHGQSLAALLSRVAARGGLPAPLAAHIIADAARGLHAAHEVKLPDGSPANVVHRDVSPQNVFLTYEGVAKVVDFGIARFADRIANDTSTGVFKGKAGYLAPEQLAKDGRKRIDRQSDVFSLGVVLWESLTGQRLFEGDTPAQLMSQLISRVIPPPSSVAPQVPRDLDPIVLKALARSKDDRYGSALDLAEDLEYFLAVNGHASAKPLLSQMLGTLFETERRDREDLLRAQAVSAQTEALRPRVWLMRASVIIAVLSVLFLAAMAVRHRQSTQAPGGPAPTALSR